MIVHYLRLTRSGVAVLTDEVATNITVLHAAGDGTTAMGDLVSGLVAVGPGAGIAVTESCKITSDMTRSQNNGCSIPPWVDQTATHKQWCVFTSLAAAILTGGTSVGRVATGLGGGVALAVPVGRLFSDLQRG